MYLKPKNKVGLYDSQLEKDNCGLGFVANIQGNQTRSIITDALTILENMDHRGAVSYTHLTLPTNREV